MSVPGPRFANCLTPFRGSICSTPVRPAVGFCCSTELVKERSRSCRALPRRRPSACSRGVAVWPVVLATPRFGRSRLSAISGGCAMESGSSAAGGTGLRVAPPEHFPLPPLVGDDRAAAYAHVGVTVDPAARALPTPRSCSRALVYAPALSSPRCAWWVPTRWSPKARVSTRGAWSAIGPSSVRVLSSVVAPWSMRGSTVGSGAVLDGVVQVAPGVHIRVGAHVQGPQAVWPDHPAAGPRGETERSGRTDVVLGVAAPPAWRAACSGRRCVRGGRACAGSGSGSLSLNVCVLRRADSISSASVVSRRCGSPRFAASPVSIPRLVAFRPHGFNHR